MSEDILDELFKQISDIFGISFVHSKEKYLTYLFNMADVFAKKGIYGATIEQGITPDTPRRAIIRRKIHETTPLFILVINSATEICKKEIFPHLNQIPYSTEYQIKKLYLKLEKKIQHYWNFICVGFLGHIFNQDDSLKKEIIKFHNLWISIIKNIAMKNWKSHRSSKEVAENSLTYILGTLSTIKTSDEYTTKIRTPCHQLKKYWLKESLLIIDSKNEINYKMGDL